ncbi:MAG: DUF3306 domain-containing protein [Gammaproteobacteria bacterium]|jgi:hypothetical protein
MKSRLPENDVAPLDEDETRASDENFLSRWSRRKREAQRAEKPSEKPTESAIEAKSKPEVVDTQPTDADMPPLESLTEDSDYSGFLSPKVSEALRKKALRKLFHSAGINVRDGLDDYDEDFTEFAKLGDIVTADLKHQLDKKMQKRFEDIEEETLEPITVVGEETLISEQDPVSTDNTEPEDKDS